MLLFRWRKLKYFFYYGSLPVYPVTTTSYFSSHKNVIGVILCKKYWQDVWLSNTIFTRLQHQNSNKVRPSRYTHNVSHQSRSLIIDSIFEETSLLRFGSEETFRGFADIICSQTLSRLWHFCISLLVICWTSKDFGCQTKVSSDLSTFFPCWDASTYFSNLYRWSERLVTNMCRKCISIVSVNGE